MEKTIFALDGVARAVDGPHTRATPSSAGHKKIVTAFGGETDMNPLAKRGP